MNSDNERKIQFTKFYEGYWIKVKGRIKWEKKLKVSKSFVGKKGREKGITFLIGSLGRCAGLGSKMEQN